MYVETLVEAVDRVVAAVEATGLKVHRPPTPLTPVQPPCVMVAVPTVNEQEPMPAGCAARYEVTVDVLVIGENPAGKGLLARADEVMAALGAAHLTIQTAREQPFEATNSPAPIPGVQITVE